MRRSTSAALGAVLVLILALAGSERSSEAPSPGASPRGNARARPTPSPGAPVGVSEVARTHAHAVEPAPAGRAERAESVTLIAGGDVSFGRKTGQRLLRDAAFDPFQGVAAVLASGDLRFVNLESTLSDQDGETEHPTKRLTFTGPPSGARALARAGIELVSVANNHAWDYGASGYFETLTHLESARVTYVGGSREPVDFTAPRSVSVRGWSTAWFAVTDIWNTGPDTARVAAPHVAFAHPAAVAHAVSEARARHDLVIVSYHGGAEYSEHIAREQREFARAVMAAGADAVIGHHPHVPQGVEWFGDRPVLHSLGNLVFNHHRDHAWTGRGFLARLRFAAGAAPRVELCPYYITDGGPVTVEADAGGGEAFRRHLKRVGSYAGASDVGPPGEYGCMRVTPRGTILAAQTQERAANRARGTRDPSAFTTRIP
jgi:poly-gamma-glutamate capsule biosynthesis protein CapA/YwtB (metallophosphatase superfamily)